MKTYVVFDTHGRITAVAVPNPELEGALELDVQPDQSVLVKDLRQIFPYVSVGSRIGVDEGLALEVAVQELATNYRVDLMTQTLVRVET